MAADVDDVGLLPRLASVTVRVGARSGNPGEHLAVPAGLTWVLVMAKAGQASGVLSVDAVVVPGRVTTISCLPWVMRPVKTWLPTQEEPAG